MNHKKNILGWTGVALTITVSGFWAYWGAIENFHEGWYSFSLWENILLMLTQYLLFMLIFMFLALAALKWRWPGLLLHIVLGGFCGFFFSGAGFSVAGLLMVIPIILLGLLYYFGDPKPKKWACRIIIIIPLAIVLIISVPQAIRVSQRVNDHDFGLRIVEGNGVTLVWAPKGPGWPDHGVSWEEAANICIYLSDDGLKIMSTPQNIWRLPTVDEAVRSMALHNQNAGGVLNPGSITAKYRVTPDKETPIWDPNSKIIYYWTSEASRRQIDSAYIIVYHGGVFEKRKTDHQDYLSFRAVKENEK